MIRLSTLQKYKANGEKFSCLTCYDASFAAAMQAAEIDTILIGDSLGMVVQGETSTLPVTVEHMAYHTAAVARGNNHALIICDLPFMSYATVEDAVASSRHVMQAGAHVVKLEGGAWLADTVRTLTQSGTPVCVHLGLTPQSVNVMSGYKVQAKEDAAVDKLMADCQAVVDAGAAILLLECVPVHVAKKVTDAFSVPVIGIGAGVDCDGQVLVMHDMLGVQQGKPAKFVKNFLAETDNVTAAFSAFHTAVKNKTYPADEHSFH